MVDARRFVLDTNVLVSAALLPEGGVRRYEPTRLCVEAARGSGVLLVSDSTLAELREVLLRPAFDRFKPRPDREAFLAAIAAEAERVEPAEEQRLCSDPDDDKFLAVALAGDADVLLTEDKAVLALKTVGRTRILRPIAFLKP
ncbi:putative toxin-antitoxin system toxin component, PIN family [Azospirillum sp.]|uniref:putative toxin-antitoxin system toxin component, PIN family n=1 Tax=Azospirillum sp. TaxID=34012 RepID=UPI003D74780F